VILVLYITPPAPLEKCALSIVPPHDTLHAANGDAEVIVRADVEVRLKALAPTVTTGCGITALAASPDCVRTDPVGSSPSARGDAPRDVAVDAELAGVPEKTPNPPKAKAKARAKARMILRLVMGACPFVIEWETIQPEHSGFGCVQAFQRRLFGAP
jgi:hypothetical protein